MKTYLSHASAKAERTRAERVAAFRRGLLTVAVALFTTSPAFANAPPRVRGIVTEADNGSITVKDGSGGLVSLKTGADTVYANVIRASLDEIKVNDFVGTAVKGPQNAMVAVELVLVPESMRAGRISYYGWDPLPDPTAGRASGRTATSMTNGVVAARKGGPGGLILTVTDDSGRRSFRITVPPNAPVTRYELAGRSTVAIGSSVFIKTNPGDRASLVTVGKGITPPQ